MGSSCSPSTTKFSVTGAAGRLWIANSKRWVSGTLLSLTPTVSSGPTTPGRSPSTTVRSSTAQNTDSSPAKRSRSWTSACPATSSLTSITRSSGSKNPWRSSENTVVQLSPSTEVSTKIPPPWSLSASAWNSWSKRR